MNIFAKIGLFSRGLKAVKELTKLKEANSEIVDEIVAIINDLIKILDRLKKVVPEVGEFIEEVIAIIKKWLKK